MILSQDLNPRNCNRNPLFTNLASAKLTEFGTLSMYDFSFFSDPRLRQLAEAITSRYLGQFELTSQELLSLADSFYNNNFSNGVLPRPYLTELLQVVVNASIYQAAEVHRHFDPSITENIPSWYALLNRWGSLLPTHTLRDLDKNDMQQYSTPPELGYVAAWCCQPTADDVLLEPSAGLAGLAVMLTPWVKATVVNEFDSERVELLRQLPCWNEVLQSDAGVIHLHPFAITGKPSLVFMNPPFSVDRGQRDRMTAARHIESALSVLEPGGRLVAILPGGIERSFNQAPQEAEFGMAMNASNFRNWWLEIQKKYTVRCNVGIDGAVYKKFGTATRTRLVIIDNVGPQRQLETITMVGGQAWTKNPLLLLHDNNFVQGAVMARKRFTAAEKEAHRKQQQADRFNSMGIKTREQYGLSTPAAPAPQLAGTIPGTDTGTADERAAAAADAVGLTPGEEEAMKKLLEVVPDILVPTAKVQTTLVNVDSQRGGVEATAARILFTLGLGVHLYEHEDFYARLDRGQREGSGMLDLVIERQGPEIFFTHWFEMNGDLCRDSEVRFLAPLDSGLLKLSGITGWGPMGEFHDECRHGGGHERDCRSFAKMMLENVKSTLSARDIEKLSLKCSDWQEDDDDDAAPQDEFPVTPPTTPAVPTATAPDVVEVEAEEIEQKEMLDVFHGYQPFVTVNGSLPHNVTLVESNTMRLAQLPIATAQVHLPKEAVLLGHISSAQLENVIYSVHAHDQLLRDKVTRKAYLIGDGTGVGKGTECAAVMMHYFLKCKGKVRMLWISKEFSLVKDAVRDWKFIGGDEKFIFTQDRYRDPEIPVDTGIMFSTYTTMSMKGSVEAKARSIDRQQQIINWLQEGVRKGYDTLMCFDESHLMGNATTTKGERGDKKASQRAIAGMDIMKALPETRVLFLSATAATEVYNLAYAAERLGLCGEHVPAFPSLMTFINAIHGGGMLAMELVAKDLKAMGLYNARSLSYEGTSFRLLSHDLTAEQISLYNEACYFWRLCYDYMKRSFDQNKTDGKGKAQTMGQFWGGAQRFFNQMLTSLQTPMAIDDMLKELATDHSIVVQLVNTNEAATNRVVADALMAEVDLDELDITPRDMLLQLIRTSYPTIQYQKIKDDRGNTVNVPMKDGNGDFIQNPEAVEMRDELLLRVAEMRVPQGALDMLIDRMEAEGFPVAEITGRSKRFVMRKDEVSGKMHRTMEPRSKKKGDAEAAEFMAGKRRVLVFSGAGNTGRSFQSDLRCANQQRRKHYVLQAGWRADEAIQGLGRTHRTNQANAPEYVLPTTNLPGQVRFITSIARRIEQLGSLTRGNRAAAANSLFKAEDNLETQWAKMAVNAIFMGLYLGKKNLIDALGDVGFAELCDMMGLNLLNEDGGIVTERIPPITQFLNRMLFLPVDMQHRLFGMFDELHTETVENARADGLLDLGVEKILGDEIIKVSEQMVHADKDTGARTHVVQLDVKRRMRRLGFEEGYQISSVDPWGQPFKEPKVVGYYLADNQKGVNFAGMGGFMKFVLNTVSNRVYGVWDAGTKTDLMSGTVDEMFRLVGPTSTTRETKVVFAKRKLKDVSVAEARILWEQELKDASEFDTHQEFLVTGAVLPVWDKLGSTANKVRIKVAETTDTHERILGRLINAGEVDKVMTNLGVGKQGVYLTPKQLVDDVLEHSSILHLANGWQVRRRRLSTGRHSLVVIGPSTRAEISGIEGLHAEVHGRDMVNVMATPDDEKERLRLFTKFTEHRPVVRIDKGGTVYDVLDKEAERALQQASQLEKVQAYAFDSFINWHEEGLCKLVAAPNPEKPADGSLFAEPVAAAVVVPEIAVVLPQPVVAEVAAPVAFEIVSNPAAVPLEALAQSVAEAVRGEVVVTYEPGVEAAQPNKLAPAPKEFAEMDAMEKALWVVRNTPKKKSAAKVVDPMQQSLF